MAKGPNEHMFGLSRVKPSKEVSEQLQKLAKDNGFVFVEMSVEGYKNWFAGPDRPHGANAIPEQNIRDGAAKIGWVIE